MKIFFVVIILISGLFVFAGDSSGSCPPGYDYRGDAVGCVKRVSRSKSTSTTAKIVPAPVAVVPPQPNAPSQSVATGLSQEDLRKLAEQKRKEAQDKKSQAQVLSDEQRNLSPEIAKTQQEIDQKRQESARLTNEQEKALTNIRNSPAAPSGISGTTGALGAARQVLPKAADSLDNMIGDMRRSGIKQEDIDKTFRDIGINPQQLSQNIREIANNIRPVNDVSDLNALQGILQRRLKEMEGEETGIRNKAAKERAEVVRIDADIAKSRNEMAEADRNRREHDRKAEQFDAQCRQNWWTCTWNTPKAAWERSMAALDQTNMNRINSWISWLNFTKVFPGSAVAMNDISAAPISSVKKMLQDQIQGVENTKRELQNMITAQRQEMEKKISDRKAQDRPAVDQMNQDLAALNSKKSSQDAKTADLDRRRKQLELEAAKAQEEADKYENMARAAQPSTGGEIRSASLEAQSAAQAINELFSQDAEQKQDDQAGEMARLQQELEAKRKAVEDAAKEQEAKINAALADMEVEEPMRETLQEEEIQVEHCQRGTWSPTFKRCIEYEEQEEVKPQDCERGSWSPTLRMCVE